MKIKKIIFGVLLFVAGLLVAIGPFTFAHVCELGEKVMKCHWTSRIELLLGVTVSLLAVLRFLLKSDDFTLGLDAAIFAEGVGILLVPTALIGVCGKAMMHCHSVTKPFLIVSGILIAVISAAEIVLTLISKNK